VKALPIPFTASMVRALLDGRKGQTRRLVKLPHMNPLGAWEPSTVGGGGSHLKDGTPYAERPCLWHTRAGDALVCPYGRVGDLLWVRESWRVGKRWDATPPRDLPARKMTVMFAAGGSVGGTGEGRYELDESYPDTLPDWAGKLRPGMFIPRWASRLTLRITDVRVERLQNISEADAIAEGIEPSADAWKSYSVIPSGLRKGKPNLVSAIPNRSPVASYSELWEAINGTGSWANNPWVWAVGFAVEKRNVDDVLGQAA
jgi:hypothetical protein